MKFKRYSTAEDTYTTLPATFQTSGADAENYQVYGKTVENLADAIIEHANINSDGRIANPGVIDPASDTFVLYIAPVVSGKAYTITTSTYDSAVVYAFYSTQPTYDVVSYNNARTVLEGTHQATITAPITGWIAFRDYVTAPAGMIVEGSTPAPIYVPPGASSGVGEETENLFDKDATDTSNGYVVYAYLTSTGDTSSSSNHFITEYIELPTGSTRLGCYTGSTNVRACFYDTNKEFISSFVTGGSSGIPQNAAYVRATISKSKTDVAMMIPDITTAPSTYIPFGYKIPILLESGEQLSNYDLFIGDTKLYDDEYVDFSEQKVYKRTENDFPFAKKGTFTFGNDGYIISNGEGKFFATIPTSVSSTVNSVLIPLNETYTIPQSLDTGGEFIFYLGNNVTKAGLLLVLYDTNGVQIENWAFTSKWRISTAYNQMAGKTIAYIGLRAVSNSEQGNIELTPMFSKNDNLTTYIPYLQPTDPPAPFPTISTYIGENNLSVDTTVQPEKVVLEYAGWREIDAKKYVNGEWVTITPKQYTGGSWS